MNPAQKLDQTFLDYIRQPLQRWDIVEGALLLACQEYPDLDTKKSISSVNEMAEAFKVRIGKDLSKTDKLEQLNRFFFEELRFQGNVENYGDPRNSYLPDLLERKLGIPISLSALYLKLAWEAEIPLFGVNFPGHFLVAWKESEIEFEKNIYIDVFNGGKILGPDELRELLARRLGKDAELEPANHLRNAGIKDILHRMLANLKAIHASEERVERALWAAEWMMLLKPQDLDSLRDKGMFCFSLGRLKEAEEALATYLEKTGRPRDFAQVWNALYAIRAQNPTNLN